MKTWLKENKNTLRGMTIFGLFPLLCSILWCLCEGHAIWDVYLPASYWNDELMYYKQVEAVVNHGLPQGYFGYQEMHAEIFNFATWSPIVLIPWCIWGLIFGWNLMSPIYANIVASMISLVIFYWLVKPDKKQSIWILVFLSVFTHYTKYILSGMPESISIALLIVFLGLAIAYMRDEKIYMLFVMFGIIGFMTLYRPYVGVLFIIPFYLSIKKYKWKGGILSFLFIGITGLLYVLILKYFCAPYIEQSLNTEWISIFRTDGFFGGIKYIYWTLRKKLVVLYQEHLLIALKTGLFSGSLYIVTGFLTLLLGIRCFISRKNEREDKNHIKLSLCYAIGVIGMIFAILLFYKMSEGAKHLMGFIVVGCLLLSMIKKKTLVMKLLVLVSCCYFFIAKTNAPYDWQVPFDDGEIKAEVMLLEEQLDKTMILSEGSNLYDNTVIWLSYDILNEEVVASTWGLLYAIPDGFALNYCSQQYVMEKITELKSCYIAAIPGGEVEENLLQNGYECIATSERMVIYQKY